jgi:hypothetical protein
MHLAARHRRQPALLLGGVPKRRIEPATSELLTETTLATTQSTRAISSQISP